MPGDEETPPARRGENSSFILGFAAIVCVTASLLLATIYVSLKERQDTNAANYEKLNILKAFGVDVYDEDERPISSDEVTKLFKAHVVEMLVDTETGESLDREVSIEDRKVAKKDKRLQPIYFWYKDAKKAGEPGVEPRRYVISIWGYGLWGNVYGYLGLQPDLATIESITFYKHQETPGLGAEVSRTWFQSQFKGKKLRDPDGQVADFRVVKGKSAADLEGDLHAVGGITAATITGEGVQQFLVDDLKRYDAFFQKLKSDEG